MVYTQMTIRAMHIAYDAHHGQVDLGGMPYILHPVHLAEQMEDEISCAAALLHDVVEDTSGTMEELAQQFPKEVMEIVKLLTHTDDLDYLEYVKKIKTNPVAVKIKLADLTHNSDTSRWAAANITEEKQQNLRSKYTQAREILLG